MSWKELKNWQNMISGQDCPMCKDIHQKENRFSFLIDELSASYARLPKNQDIHGRVLVALKRHANELYELTPEELTTFWQDVTRVAKAIKGSFEPIKIYYGIFGGQCPHLHCHVLPMHVSDDPYTPLAIGQTEYYWKILNTNKY